MEEPGVPDIVSNPELTMPDDASDSDQSTSPQHRLLSYLRNRKPEAFAVEVDASKGITAADELPNFESVLQRVRALCKLSPPSSEPSTIPTGSPLSSNTQDHPRSVRFDCRPRFSNFRNSAGALDTMDADPFIRDATMDLPPRGFTWVSFQTTSPEYIARLGRECRLHSLTIDDITNDAYEKTEPFQRRGYTYCMIDSEDMYGNNAHIHICPGRRGAPTRGGPAPSPSPAYTLADLDVDWMMETAEMLVQEAQETDQLMLRTSSKEQPDVLRRISLARSRIYTQRQRNFSKQRLLMVLASSGSESFVAPQMKLYLRDVDDHIQCCSQRLNFAQDVLSQASNNYVACISIEEAQLANRMNILLGRLTLLTVVFIPFNLFAGLFGMNVEVPMRDVPGLGPWCGIVFTGIVFCTMGFLVLYRLDQQQQNDR